MHGRRGTSLVELMLNLSACTVILTMSAGLIHRAMHAQSKGRLFFNGERSALRLAESFRRDVHDANAAATADEIGDDDVLLRLQLVGGQTIEYRQLAGRVERVQHAGGSIRAYEAFDFSPEMRATSKKESPHLVTLSIVPPNDAVGPADSPLPSYTAPVYLQAEAVIGRNASFVDAINLPEATP